VEQISLERGLTGTDRQTVIAALARDIELLERLTGHLTSVSAIGASGDPHQLRGLTVQMIGPRGIPVRWWSFAVSEASGPNRLIIAGEKLRLVVEMRPSSNAWRVEESSILLEGPVEFDASSQAIKKFTSAVASIDRGESAAEFSTWERATEAMEVADVVELSLQKGKTIEVLHQQLTEDLAFRGTMSALGCGLLMAMLLGVVAAGIIGDALGWQIARHWPMLLLVVFGVFLLAQFVPKLFPPRES
jgi:hypothetical protein